MEHKPRAEFAMQLRNIDSMLSVPELAQLLYAEPIGPLPDARKHGKIEPPEAMLRELDAVTAAHGRAASTRRESRATVRKLWTAAVKSGSDDSFTTLDELLLAADRLDLDKRTRRIAARLLGDLRSCPA